LSANAALAVLGDFLSLAQLRGKPYGATWFRAADTEVGERRLPILFPRLCGHDEPDDAFAELVDRLLVSGDERGATLLVPRRVTTPADLWHPRIADVKDPSRIGSPSTLAVPMHVLIGHGEGDERTGGLFDGKRDRGRNAIFDKDHYGWVGRVVAYDVLGHRDASPATDLRQIDDAAAFAANSRIHGAEQANAKHGQRGRHQARTRLSGERVLPWACWPNQDLPHDWVGSPELQQAVQEWRDQASGVVRRAGIVEAALNARRRAA
jgi:hypothetical protein